MSISTAAHKMVEFPDSGPGRQCMAIFVTLSWNDSNLPCSAASTLSHQKSDLSRLITWKVYNFTLSSPTKTSVQQLHTFLTSRKGNISQGLFLIGQKGKYKLSFSLSEFSKSPMSFSKSPARLLFNCKQLMRLSRACRLLNRRNRLRTSSLINNL